MKYRVAITEKKMRNLIAREKLAFLRAHPIRTSGFYFREDVLATEFVQMSHLLFYYFRDIFFYGMLLMGQEVENSEKHVSAPYKNIVKTR